MNVLMIDIDTLRPDHMGCYGYRRNTTPNIDEVAREGVRFQNMFCSDAPCLPSRASLLSGMFGIKNGVVGHGGTAADRFRGGRREDFGIAGMSGISIIFFGEPVFIQLLSAHFRSDIPHGGLMQA